MTETLIILKFDWDLVTRPLPHHIATMWAVIGAGLVIWTIWYFLVKPKLFPSDQARQSEDVILTQLLLSPTEPDKQPSSDKGLSIKHKKRLKKKSSKSRPGSVKSGQ